jgi:hypothetical protein
MLYSHSVGVFNVGGFNRTKQNLAIAILEQLPNIKVLYTGKSDGRDYSVSFEKIESLGYKAQITPEHGIKNLIDALQKGIFDNPNDRKWVNA